jgi:hypothetical protein
MTLGDLAGPYLPPVPALVPLGVAVVAPVGVVEPGIDLEVADVDGLGVLGAAGLTGAGVVEGGLRTGGVIDDGVPGVVLGTGGIPDGTGVLVDGLPGVGGTPGAGAWARSKEAASDRAGSSMVSPSAFASTYVPVPSRPRAAVGASPYLGSPPILSHYVWTPARHSSSGPASASADTRRHSSRPGPRGCRCVARKSMLVNTMPAVRSPRLTRALRPTGL